MPDANRNFTLIQASNLFKIKYEKLSENVYNSSNVLLGRCKKSYNFTGEKLSITIPQSFSGGVGSGTLPKANVAVYGKAEISAKKMYAVVEIDRETIKAALSDEGAFVRATKEVVQKGVESFMRNLSRCLFNDGTGQLGTLSSVADGSTDDLTVASFKEANFEERDLVDIYQSDGTTIRSVSGTPLEIDAVTPATSLVNVTGADARSTVAGDILYMQGSNGNDCDGLKGVLQKSDSRSASYGITHARRWESQSKAAASAAISTDMLNEMMLKVKKSCGKSPNLIVASYKQYEKILNLLEDQKRFTIPTRAGLKSKSGADISFSGVEFMSVDGPVGIFPERFVEDDTVYLLNDNHIHIYHRPDFGWFDDDGTVFLRKADADSYEARYGGYLQVYINPCFHGYISGLST